MSVFSYQFQVRWSDIDSYDHVNNVRYFDYLQEARIAFLAELTGVDGDYFAAYPVVLVSQTVDYLKPILLRQAPYEVEVWVAHVGTSSYTLASRIVDEDQVCATATSVLVAVTAATHAKRPLSEAERAALLRSLPTT